MSQQQPYNPSASGKMFFRVSPNNQEDAQRRPAGRSGPRRGAGFSQPQEDTDQNKKPQQNTLRIIPLGGLGDAGSVVRR